MILSSFNPGRIPNSAQPSWVTAANRLLKKTVSHHLKKPTSNLAKFTRSKLTRLMKYTDDPANSLTNVNAAYQRFLSTLPVNTNVERLPRKQIRKNIQSHLKAIEYDALHPTPYRRKKDLKK
jgi:hypothetical protein